VNFENNNNSRYFSYVPEFDDQGKKLSDVDGDGDIDVTDFALYGMDRLRTANNARVEKHDEAVARIEAIAQRCWFKINSSENYAWLMLLLIWFIYLFYILANNSAGMTKLDRSEWFEVNLGNAVVSPPSGDAMITVYVRGRRLCRKRAAREEKLRNRLAQASKLKQMVGLRGVKVNSLALELASEDFAMFRLPIRLFRSRVELFLRRTRLNIENKILFLMHRSTCAFRDLIRAILPQKLVDALSLGPTSQVVNRLDFDEEFCSTRELALMEKSVEERTLQARREIYEHVFIMRRDSQTGEILFIKLFKDVPTHKVTLLIPTHHVAIASSEQVRQTGRQRRISHLSLFIYSSFI
jgi:hypothetical protein